MKFYINGKIVSSKDFPLVLILEHRDKKNIANMKPGATVYCQYESEGHNIGEIDKLCTEAKSK